MPQKSSEICPRAFDCPRGELCHSPEGEDLCMQFCPVCGQPLYTGVCRYGVSALVFMSGVPLDECRKAGPSERQCQWCRIADDKGEEYTRLKIPSKPMYHPRLLPKPLK